MLGAHTDDQEGGWVISEMVRNLDLCIAEKTKKIENYKSRYPEWWLILVDRVSFGAWIPTTLPKFGSMLFQPI